MYRLGYLKGANVLVVNIMEGGTYSTIQERREANIPAPH